MMQSIKKEENNGMEMEIDLKEVFRALKKRAVLIILVALLFGAAVFAVTNWCVTPIYTASASMYVNNASERGSANVMTTSDLSASQQLVETYLVVLRSDTVLEKVAQQLSHEVDIKTLSEMLTAAPINSTEAFSVSVTHEDPAFAAEVANVIANVAPEEIVRVVKAGSVEVIDYAKVPETPSSPRKMRNTALAMMLGLVLAAGAVVLQAMLDKTLHTEADLTAAFDIPVIGQIPKMPRKAARERTGEK